MEKILQVNDIIRSNKSRHNTQFIVENYTFSFSFVHQMILSLKEARLPFHYFSPQ